MAVGDISFGDYPFCAGFGIRSSLTKGLSPFKDVLPILTQGDIVFGNLETVISDYDLNPHNLSSWQMRGTLKNASMLKEAGFTVVNIANNHTMQHGSKPFFETINALQGQKINPIGLREESNKCRPVIIECKGYSIGFLGYAFEEDAYKNKRIEYSFGPLCNIEHDIRSLREKVQILIVSCHWGLEFITRPSPNTIRLGRNIIEWGADIILGHHSHVLQGFEYYKDGIIIYSMGNFLFDMLWDKKFRESAIFLLEINENKIQVKPIPIYISDNYSIAFLDSKEKEKSIENYTSLCNEVDSTIQGDLERKILQYYLEYESLRKKNKLRSYMFFLKNILKVDRRLLPQIIGQTSKRWLRVN